SDCAVDLISFENSNFNYNVIDGNNDTYATLTAGAGLAAGLGSFEGHIEMGFSAPVAAGEVSYVRINMEEEGLLEALVGGSLGDILSDVADLVAFGNHYFDVTVKDAIGNEIYTESGQGGFSNNRVRIVRDAIG